MQTTYKKEEDDTSLTLEYTYLMWTLLSKLEDKQGFDNNIKFPLSTLTNSHDNKKIVLSIFGTNIISLWFLGAKLIGHLYWFVYRLYTYMSILSYFHTWIHTYTIILGTISILGALSHIEMHEKLSTLATLSIKCILIWTYCGFSSGPKEIVL